ncbi:uncharacterized protein LOC122505287 [Leptopilina heterotoma]|uniref:uncharacterized protein LOC122505287 n=1 Tax=Leptopilina heterotoma TaxID=63436 RepID=UPI001CAA3BAB|nr:uncharacterized protein LOC122505287 [Leptopilina heterotoma]
MPIYSKSARCFPNECYICKSRGNLIRCECSTISYCSEDHRQQHLSTHEDFCNVVKELLKIRKVTHIYEELIYIFDLEWDTKREEIRNEIIKKLGRTFSPLEFVMLQCPRICFVCHKTKQEDLIDCPHCPIASFCKKHKKSQFHDQNCKVMSTYLKILTTADELNTNLDFLSFFFPFIEEKTIFMGIDALAQIYDFNDRDEDSLESRLTKMNLIDFIDVSSKIHNALQEIHETIPEELTIHIDALSYEHSITKENYWEFLLHLNPQMKKLKIVITAIQNRDNLETSLCENCISNEKELTVEYLSKSYDDYMLDENYQKPNLLFHVKIVNECNSERLNNWSKLDFPIMLRFESNLNFCKTQHFLSFSRVKFRFIYAGQIRAPFTTLSSIKNKDFFIILQSKENKVLEKSSVAVTDEICVEKNGTITTETVLVKNIDSILNCAENIITDNVEDASKITPLEVHTSNDEQIKEQESEDKTLSPSSSSVCSFVIISEPGAEEKERKEEEVEKNTAIENSKPEENDNCSKSIHNEASDTEDVEQKSDEKNNVEIEKREAEEKNEKQLCANLENVENSQNSLSQSFLIDHISYLNNEIDELRKRLNASVEEVARQQIKYEQVLSTQLRLDKENKLMRKVLCDIVNTTADIDSVLKNKS